MSLTLSSPEVEQLQTALRVLLSPLEYPAVDDWRAAACRSLKQLFRADGIVFMLSETPERPLFTEDYPDGLEREYVDYYHAKDPPGFRMPGGPEQISSLRRNLANIPGAGSFTTGARSTTTTIAGIGPWISWACHCRTPWPTPSPPS